MHVLFLFQVAFHIATLLLLSLPGIWSLPLNSTPEELQFSKLDEIARSIHQKRDTIVENNCANTANKSWGNSTKKALREASEMMDYALPLLQGLWKILKSKPVPSKIGMSPAQRTVFQTYEAFYGQAYFVDDKANQYIAKNGAAIKRLEELIGTAESIQFALKFPGRAKVQIYCNDSFLYDTDPFNNSVSNMRWDSRRWATEYVGEWAPVPECSNRPTLAGFAYNPKTAPFGGQYHNLAPIATGKWHIDNLRGFLPAVLIHELTHAKSILAGKVLLDQHLTNKVSAYGWQNIHQLARENPDLATWNADSFALFVAAIYFNRNDWSTGIAQNLGYFPLGG